MWILKLIFLSFTAASFGCAVAGGYLALISMIGIVPRLASTSKTGKYVLRYENALIYGAVTGNLLYCYPIILRAGPVIPAAAGLFSGVFVGCLASALAEVVNVLPIFVRRTNLRKGIPYIIYALGFGKGVGVLAQFFFLK